MSKGGKKYREILLAAADLFKKQGYTATTMRQLAKSVNIEPSSLYSHIQSKEEILRIICFDHAERFIDKINEISKLDTLPFQKIQALLLHQIEIAYADSTSITVFNDEWKHLSEPFLTDFLKLRKAYEESFREIINTGISSGTIKNIDSKTIFNTLISSVKWVYFQSKKDTSPAHFENIVDLVLGGIVLIVND